MLKADFSQQNEDKRKSPLQPRNHSLQLGQSRSWGGLVILGLLPGAVPLRASCGGGLLEQRGCPVLQWLMVEVVVVMVVLGRPGEEWSTLRPMAPGLLPGSRSHMDENFRRRA